MARNEEEKEDGSKAPEPIDVETTLEIPDQISMTEKLQAGLLRTYLRRIQNGTISDTGLANVQRLLQANGWSLDPKQLPQDLKDLLTTAVDPNELDADVLPIRRKA